MRRLLGAMVIGAAVTAGLGLVAATLGPAAGAAPTSSGGTPPTFLGGLHQIAQVGSTVPANGDVNPYGVAVVPTTIGQLTAGDTLVSNFNDQANVQGTGTTIVEVSPGGATQLFADLGQLPAGLSCPGGIGLTTALAVLPGGWVVVGSLPTTTGGALPALDPVGCLVVLNAQGTAVETLTDPDIVGPWDMTALSGPGWAQLFVSNALGGTTRTRHGVPVAGECTVVRLDLRLGLTTPPALTGATVIGQDFPWHANQAALVLAPTGLALGRDGTLFVDDTETDAVYGIGDAPIRTTAVTAASVVLSSGGSLRAPLGMTMAPDGDLVVVNGNDGAAVELDQAGHQLATRTLVKGGAGDLFGVTLTADHTGLLFVNDGTNALDSATP